VEDVEELLTRGKALLQRERERAAVELFERATQLDPRSFEAWFYHGHALSQVDELNDSAAEQLAARGLAAFERAAVGRPLTTIHSRCNNPRFVPIGSRAITVHINVSIRRATSGIRMASATEHEPRAYLNHGSVAVPRRSSRIFQRGLPLPWDRGSHCASSAPTLRRICAHRRVCRRR